VNDVESECSQICKELIDVLIDDKTTAAEAKHIAAAIIELNKVCGYIDEVKNRYNKERGD